MRKHRRSAALSTALPALALAAALAGAPARANDRPFQFARTAIAEDDDHVWSFESWAQRYGNLRSLSFEPEYVFTPAFSVQAELSRALDRTDTETGTEAEVEFKYVFNDIRVDGVGWGLSATLAAEHTAATGRTSKLIGIKLPVSISLWDGAYLHLDGGINKASDSRRAWSSSAGLEHALTRRSTVFAELAHEGDLVFAQAGVRHWLQREKLAIDLSLQQQRSDGHRASGFILGVGWYDL